MPRKKAEAEVEAQATEGLPGQEGLEDVTQPMEDPDAEAVVESTTAEVTSIDAAKESQVAVATTPPPPMTNTSALAPALGQLSDAGFGGLELDWTSFPAIILDKGSFTNREGEDYEDVKGFKFRIMRTYASWVVRSKHSDQDDQEAIHMSSQSELTDETSDVYQKIQQWKEEDDAGYETKEYTQVLGQVCDEEFEEMNGQVAVLSIPPKSRGRLSGLLTTQKMMRGLEPQQYYVRCAIGKKITKSKYPFYPWAFDFAGVVEEEVSGESQVES